MISGVRVGDTALDADAQVRALIDNGARDNEQQAGEEAGGEPALGDRLGRRRGDRRARAGAVAAAPVAEPQVHDPGDLHLPADLFAGLGAEPFERGAAAGAGPLVLGQVVDHLAGLQPGVVPAAVSLAAAALAAPAGGRVAGVRGVGLRLPAVGAGLVVSAVRGGAVLLRLAPEQDPGQRRELLGQLRGPLLRLGQAFLRLLQPRLGQLGALAPVRRRLGGDVVERGGGGHGTQDTPRTPP
jgi:hypothetical protein